MVRHRALCLAALLGCGEAGTSSPDSGNGGREEGEDVQDAGPEDTLPDSPAPDPDSGPPPSDFQVTATWGTSHDVDLHFARQVPDCTWFNPACDVWEENPVGEWGEPELAEDNAVLTESLGSATVELVGGAVGQYHLLIHRADLEEGTPLVQITLVVRGEEWVSGFIPFTQESYLRFGRLRIGDDPDEICYELPEQPNFPWPEPPPIDRSTVQCGF